MYNFEPGEDVKVLEKNAIIQSLDANKMLDGVLFMDNMWQFCGKTFKILKVVRNFFNYQNEKLYRCRSPVYILDGLRCDGKSLSFDRICDKSCHLLWHQSWIEKYKSSST
jgi:hypothetical protein